MKRPLLFQTSDPTTEKLDVFSSKVQIRNVKKDELEKK